VETPVIYRSLVSGIVTQHALKQNKNINTITDKNAGNRPYSRIFEGPKSGALGLSLFILMVNPRLLQVHYCKKDKEHFTILL